MDFVLGAAPVPDYREPDDESDSAWPEVGLARTSGATVIRQRQAPDRTPVISAAAPVGNLGQVLMTTRNAVDITNNIRDARQTLAIIVSAATIISILLSLFLARTIVQPLRMLGGAPLSACGWGASVKWWCRACPSGVTKSACSPAPFPT